MTSSVTIAREHRREADRSIKTVKLGQDLLRSIKHVQASANSTVHPLAESEARPCICCSSLIAKLGRNDATVWQVEVHV